MKADTGFRARTPPRSSASRWSATKIGCDPRSGHCPSCCRAKPVPFRCTNWTPPRHGSEKDSTHRSSIGTGLAATLTAASQSHKTSTGSTEVTSKPPSIGDRVERAIEDRADAEREIERGEAEARPARGLARTAFWLAVTAISLYLVAPSLIDVVGSGRDLSQLALAWFPAMAALQGAALACLWVLQRVALKRAPWRDVIDSQLAGNALAKIAPGGGALGRRPAVPHVGSGRARAGPCRCWADRRQSLDLRNRARAPRPGRAGNHPRCGGQKPGRGNGDRPGGIRVPAGRRGGCVRARRPARLDRPGRAAHSQPVAA